VGTGTTVTADAVLSAVIVVVSVLLALGLLSVQRHRVSRWSRPLLPPDDRPPAGLGRLVPVGSQVDEECRRGLAALERWLLSDRSRSTGP
jgi:hypothetical protein